MLYLLMIEWLSPWYSSIPQERRATSIGFHENVVSVWEALVWWLRDLVSDMLLFHRSVEPQVSDSTATWFPCGRLLSDDWVIESLLFFYFTGAKSHMYRLPWERGVRVGCSCLMIEWLSLWYSSVLQERRATSIGYHANVVSVWEALVWWLSDLVSDMLIFHRSSEPQVLVTMGTWFSCGRLLSDVWVI